MVSDSFAWRASLPFPTFFSSASILYTLVRRPVPFCLIYIYHAFFFLVLFFHSLGYYFSQHLQAWLFPFCCTIHNLLPCFCAMCAFLLCFVGNLERCRKEGGYPSAPRLVRAERSSLILSCEERANYFFILYFLNQM